MNAERYERLMDLVTRARDLPAPERPAFIDESCGSNADLRAQVLSFLDIADESGAFLVEPVVPELAARAVQEVLSSVVGAEPATHPQRVGPYHLIEPIGEGGFGIVYLAERRDPIVQRVALKVIKPGMDTRAVIARFEHERRALAAMDHPGIARVLDAGTTGLESGRPGLPYFVMELVSGPPITRYADSARLSLRDRISLMIPVCEAVSHAHTKGLIHRDLKPSNVLVQEVDGRPVPKVIDFGIAKALADDAGGQTTEVGSMLGTPHYMAPEQILGADLDTRTDVHGLGILLYELLAGVLPVDGATLRGRSPEDIRRIVRDQDPPVPSRRLRDLMTSPTPEKRDTLRMIGEARRIDPDALVRALRRELEWIPQRAVRRVREERYRSPAELADDLRNFLARRPLLAGPETAPYRLRKFVRRHRVPVLAATGIAFTLTAGTLGTSIFAIRESRIRREAERRAVDLRDITKFQQETLARPTVAAVGLAMVDLLEAEIRMALARQNTAEPEIAARLERWRAEADNAILPDAARKLIDDQFLRPAARAAQEQFEARPALLASLNDAIGRTYLELSLFEPAKGHLEAALVARRSDPAADQAEIAASLEGWAQWLYHSGRAAEAEVATSRAVASLREALGPDAEETLAAELNLVVIQAASRDPSAILPQASDLVSRCRRSLGEAHRTTLSGMSILATLLAITSQPDAAVAAMEEAATLASGSLGPRDRDTAIYKGQLALLLFSAGRRTEAMEALDDAMIVLEDRAGLLDAEVLSLLEELGGALEPVDIDRALAIRRQVFEGRRHVLGADHELVLLSELQLGHSLLKRGDPQEAEAAFRSADRRALEIMQLGECHPYRTPAVKGTIESLRRQGRVDEAERLAAAWQAACP